MGMMIIASLNTYAKNIKMAMRWQERVEKNDYTPDKPEFVDKSFQNKIEEDDPTPERSEQMEMDIEIKLNAGKKLSAEEMAYLKAYDPSAYQKAKTILQERKVYEKALEACKTKDEVEELKARYASAAVERIRMIRNTPGLSTEKKRELLKTEHLRAAALDDGMHEFIKSREYNLLPAGTKNQKAEDTEEGLIKKGLTEKGNTEETKKAGQNKAVQVYPDDFAEEGSIMKAILDEEARWMEEEEENAVSDQPQAEEPLESQQINRAKAAYFAAQVYTIYGRGARIDVKK